MPHSTDISPIARVMRRVDEATDGSPSPDTIATGFPSVDKLLGGGVRRGDLIVIGGEVSSGKSALALAMALRIAEGERTVAFLSGEMSMSRIMERALAIEGRVSLDEIRTGKLDDVSRASLGAAAVRLRDRAPQVDRLVAGGIASLGDDLRRRRDLEVAICDSLQAVAVGARNRQEELAAAVRDLKLLAVETDVAIIVTTQLSELQRDRPDMRPQLADYGALGAIAEHADVMLGLFREEMYDTARGIEGATELIVNKNRNGGMGYADLYFYKKWMRFEDMLDADR